jgi:hypothetical protein
MHDTSKGRVSCKSPKWYLYKQQRQMADERMEGRRQDVTLEITQKAW